MPGLVFEFETTIANGFNYRLSMPMDSGRSPKGDPLTGAGLLRNQTFQLKVRIGPVTYLPIEMVASHPLGQPAGTTRLDLTLGIALSSSLDG